MARKDKREQAIDQKEHTVTVHLNNLAVSARRVLYELREQQTAVGQKVSELRARLTSYEQDATSLQDRVLDAEVKAAKAEERHQQQLRKERLRLRIKRTAVRIAQLEAELDKKDN